MVSSRIYTKLKVQFIKILSFTVLSVMNNKYRVTLSESKKLNGSGLLQKASAYNITADRILYDHAIQMVNEFIEIYYSLL